MIRLPCMLALLFFAAAASVLPARADSLKEAETWPEMGVLGRKNRSEEAWFHKKPNLLKLFSTQEGAQLINQWIGTVSGAFKAGKFYFEKDEDMFRSTRAYTSGEGGEFSVSVLVPHPRVLSILEFGLIRPFAEAERPKAKSIQEVEVRGRHGRLFEKESGECFLVLKLPSQSVVTVTAPSCAKPEKLLELASKLDLDRLDQKLSS